MKGSTLHRSGLTREKMGVLANISQIDTKKQTTKAQLNQYYRATKAQELDLLWGNVQKGIQKVHNVAKTTKQKSPAVYLTIGFVAGVLFMCLITLIVSIFSMHPKATNPIETKSNVTVIGSDSLLDGTSDVIVSQEKYVVKKGDTLNGIAYRFYGKYDESKILEIQRINNIVNPAAIRIGQEILVPVSQER
ncbi:MAG: LysM peptidoglycan-binding domain-containing protein [Candidatus Gastranaerophilales bacterium]|nr:LysM peptidoglycan-binding domain-containing protein [Candidatus Gastranaerophilales bacterium]